MTVHLAAVVVTPGPRGAEFVLTLLTSDVRSAERLDRAIRRIMSTRDSLVRIAPDSHPGRRARKRRG